MFLLPPPPLHPKVRNSPNFFRTKTFWTTKINIYIFWGGGGRFFVLVLLSALVERFSVSCINDFSYKWRGNKLKCDNPPTWPPGPIVLVFGDFFIFLVLVIMNIMKHTIYTFFIVSSHGLGPHKIIYNTVVNLLVWLCWFHKAGLSNLWFWIIRKYKIGSEQKVCLGVSWRIIKHFYAAYKSLKEMWPMIPPPAPPPLPRTVPISI